MGRGRVPTPPHIRHRRRKSTHRMRIQLKAQLSKEEMSPVRKTKVTMKKLHWKRVDKEPEDTTPTIW